MRVERRDAAAATLLACVAMLTVVVVEGSTTVVDLVKGPICNDYGTKMCFSCASVISNTEWQSAFEKTLARPANFTDACNYMRTQQYRVDVVPCRSGCVTVVEPHYVTGIYVGVRYTRGCFDSMFSSQHGRTVVHELFANHTFERGFCKNVARKRFFNEKVRADPLEICVCNCDRCNVYPVPIPSSTTTDRWRSPVSVFALVSVSLLCLRTIRSLLLV